jgi:hypothetical protein
MQTTTEITTTSTDDLDKQIELAEAKLKKARAAAVDADAEAQRWQTTFEREPTSASHTNSAIYAQRARNAHALVDTLEREQLAPLREQQRHQRRERDEAAMRSIVDRIGEARDGARDAITTAGSALSELVATLGEFDRRQQQSSVAYSIEHAQIARLCERMQREVNAQLEGARAAVQFTNTGQIGELVVRLTLDADVPHTLR